MNMKLIVNLFHYSIGQEEVSGEQIERLTIREQQLVQQVSELERQLNRVPQQSEVPALRELRDQLVVIQKTSEELQAQLAHKVTSDLS